jgi:hypothetical protein
MEDILETKSLEKSFVARVGFIIYPTISHLLLKVPLYNQKYKLKIQNTKKIYWERKRKYGSKSKCRIL